MNVFDEIDVYYPRWVVMKILIILLYIIDNNSCLDLKRLNIGFVRWLGFSRNPIVTPSDNRSELIVHFIINSMPLLMCDVKLHICLATSL